MKERIPTPKYKRSIGKEIDLTLAVLRVVCPERPMTYTQMAEIVGCHHNTFFRIGNNAMRKLRARLMAKIGPEEMQQLGELLREL